MALSNLQAEEALELFILETVYRKGLKNRIYCLKLMTDKYLDAYQMYRRIGFNEFKYVLMSKWYSNFKDCVKNAS